MSHRKVGCIPFIGGCALSSHDLLQEASLLPVCQYKDLKGHDVASLGIILITCNNSVLELIRFLPSWTLGMLLFNNWWEGVREWGMGIEVVTMIYNILHLAWRLKYWKIIEYHATWNYQLPTLMYHRCPKICNSSLSPYFSTLGRFLLLLNIKAYRSLSDILECLSSSWYFPVTYFSPIYYNWGKFRMFTVGYSVVLHLIFYHFHP